MPDWLFPEFEWDEGNVEHLAERHGVFPEEAEQVFYNRAFTRREGAYYHAFGHDDDGRYLFVVCMRRAGRVRIVSARDMTHGERRFYDRNR